MECFRRARAQTKETLGSTAAAHNRLLYFQKTLEEAGLNPFSYSLELYGCYWDYILERMEPAQGVPALFEKLKKHGIKTAVCTDLTAQIQHRKLRRLGIAGYIDVFVSSEEAGVEKPGQPIFGLLLQKLGIPPGGVLYVGDSFEKDVAGAAQAGMRPVWYNPGGGYAVPRAGDPSGAGCPCKAPGAAAEYPLPMGGGTYYEIQNFAQLERMLFDE